MSAEIVSQHRRAERRFSATNEVGNRTRAYCFSSPITKIEGGSATEKHPGRSSVFDLPQPLHIKEGRQRVAAFRNTILEACIAAFAFIFSGFAAFLDGAAAFDFRHLAHGGHLSDLAHRLHAAHHRHAAHRLHHVADLREVLDQRRDVFRIGPAAARDPSSS